MSDDIVFNTRELDKLIKAFTGKLPVAHVGIIGTKDQRSKGKASSNATIGAKHEFGDEGLPVRSFLRVPLTQQFEKYLEKSGAFNKDVLRKVIKDGSILEWMKKIAIVGETIVSDAFATGGFGAWKPSNMLFKQNQQTLVETQQLRNSITSEVKE